MNKGYLPINVKNFDEFLNLVTAKTEFLFGNKVSYDQLFRFYSFFEDEIIYEMRCKNVVGIKSFNSYKRRNDTSNNLKYALIASEISPDGKLDEGKFYNFSFLAKNHYNKEIATMKAYDLDRKRFKMSYWQDVNYFINTSSFYPNVIKIDMDSLLALGIAHNERLSGYISENKNVVDNVEYLLQTAWEHARYDLEQKGGKDSLTYLILSEVFKRPSKVGHFPLACEFALRQMVEIDSIIRTSGVESFQDEEYLDRCSNYTEASKVLCPHFMEKIAEKYDETVYPVYGYCQVRRRKEIRRRRLIRKNAENQNNTQF